MTVQAVVDISSAIVVEEDEFEDAARALNKDFVERFMALNIQKAALREFVYALDHLHEMMEVEGCPINQTLVSPDTEKHALQSFFLFNELYRMTNNASWKMTLVNKEIKAWIKEFFDRRYITNISFIMDRMGVDELELVYDNRAIVLVLNEIVPQSKLNVLELYDVAKKQGIKIPFAKVRAGHTLKVKAS
jgi:hypothetical protein